MTHRWKTSKALFKFQAHSILTINDSIEAKTLGKLIEESKDSYIAHKVMSHLNTLKDTLVYLKRCPPNSSRITLMRLWFEERKNYWYLLKDKIPPKIFTFTLNVMTILYRQTKEEIILRK